MLKAILQHVIRSYKSPDFCFDDKASSRIILSFMLKMLVEWLRGLRLLLSLRLPRFLFIGRGVSFNYLGEIEIGKWVVVGDYVTLSGLGRGKLILGDCCRIGSFSRVVVSTTLNNLGEHIWLGDHVAIGEFSSLGGSGGLEIGANTITGQYFSVHPENHRYDKSGQLIRKQGTIRKKIKIGENCWLGAKVTVLAGVTIGNNCVIGAGSVVTKDIPDNSLAIGSPARIVKTIS